MIWHFKLKYSGRFCFFYSRDGKQVFTIQIHTSTFCPSSKARNPYRRVGIPNPNLTDWYLVDVKIEGMTDVGGRLRV